MKSGADSVRRAVWIASDLHCRNASSNGSAFNNTPWTTLKMAPLAPMQREGHDSDQREAGCAERPKRASRSCLNLR
jgi:hypothetical protein